MVLERWRKLRRENCPNYPETVTRSYNAWINKKTPRYERKIACQAAKATNSATGAFRRPTKNFAIFNIHNNLLARHKFDNKLFAIFSELSGRKTMLSCVLAAAAR